MPASKLSACVCVESEKLRQGDDGSEKLMQGDDRSEKLRQGDDGSEKLRQGDDCEPGLRPPRHVRLCPAPRCPSPSLAPADL
jgi:hypothetical protein